MIGDILENSLKKALDNLSLEGDISLEHPASLENGDYSSNIAMVLAKKVGESPIELATKIVCELEKGMPEEVERVEAVSPGFINFYLTEEFFQKKIEEILKEGSNFGKNKGLEGQKIIVEYTDPNPFKEFHIGHLMSNAIGESISRIIEFSGAETKRANYQGDVGMHIAKALFGLEEGKNLKEAYSYGAELYEKDEKTKKKIEEINKKLYEKSDKELNTLYQKGRQDSLKAFEEIYEKLGTKFDYSFFESEMAEGGVEIIKNNPNLFHKSQGAIIFKGENYDLHTRVFINSEGIPTYEAKELALAKVKYEKFPYDKSIVITANEINEYFKVLLKVMELVYEKEQLAEKTEHIGHGFLKLPTGKMSSRTGNIISAEKLINEVKEKALEVMRGREIENVEEVAEMVAISALKYSILKQSIGKDIVFDLDKAVSFEGDSGPYLQYTYVRAKSLLEKGEKPNFPEVGHLEKIYGPEKMLYKFPEIVERAWEEKAPQLVSKFLIDLAGEFNSFYAKEKIVEEGGEYRILITEAVANILEKGLYLLGIKVPLKM